MTPEEVKPHGYDEEERYFREKDLELIKQKRAELNAARQQREQQQGKPECWMRCPKCGADMEEIAMEGIMVDKCTGCDGLYLDKGEVDLILETQRGWKSAFKKLFG